MLAKHPQFEWIFTRRTLGGFELHCALCRTGAILTQDQAAQFINQHSAHRSSSPTHHGAGDALAAVAKPLARLFGRKAGCLPCERRRAQMNQAMPAVPFLRRR